MTGEITIGLRDVIALLVGLGAPLAVYVAMRERLVKLETVIIHLTKTIEEQGIARRSHGEDIGEVRERLENHDARIGSIEKRLSGSYAAQPADATGGHKR